MRLDVLGRRRALWCSMRRWRSMLLAAAKQRVQPPLVLVLALVPLLCRCLGLGLGLGLGACFCTFRRIEWLSSSSAAAE
jgi:hypothetical protein